MSIQGDFISGIREIINQLGSNFDLIDTANSSRRVRAAITTLGKQDAELVGEIGVDTRVAYMGSINPLPNKFDRLVNTGLALDYVIHDVHPIPVNDTVVGVMCILKGD